MALRKLKLGLLALVVAGQVSISAAANTPQDAFQMPPSKVELITVESRLMAPQIEVTGTVISLNNAKVAAEVEGPVVWLADVGTKVVKGDIIARIDDRLLKVAVRRASANVKGLQANLIFREAEVTRYSDLATRDNASRARLDGVIADRDMAAQNLEEAKANLDRADGDLARTSIKAPFSGHIVQRIAGLGEYMTIGKEVIHLVDTEHLEIAMPVPLAVYPFIKAGEVVEVRSKFGVQMLPVRTVVPVGEQTSRMMEVRLSIPAGTWIIGTPVAVNLPNAEVRETIAVPRDAIILKGSEFYVFRVKSDNIAEQVRIEVDAAIGNWVSLTSGIEAGDRVVVRGAERLMPGATVDPS